MRILLSCLQDLRPHPIPGYRFWADYFKNGIVEAGHEWTEVPDVDWAEGCAVQVNELRTWRDRTWSKAIEWVKRELAGGHGIDLSLSYFFPRQIEPAAIGELKRLGIPCVNFFCDNVREFTRVPKEFHYFDLHWVPEFEALPMYTRVGLKTCFAPMPCWVPPEVRAPIVSENGEVIFIGSSDELRRALFSKALSLGAPIKIGGAGWTEDSTAQNRPRKAGRSIKQIARHQAEILRDRGFRQWARRTAQRITPQSYNRLPNSALLPKIDSEDYVKLTRESMITLGVNRVPSFRRSRSEPLTYSRLRDIEAPMMGACYLTEWVLGLEQLYDVGHDIETYRTAEEMVMKIEQLKSDPHRRSLLRRNGQRKALTDLSISKSLERIAHALL